jgi:hypothetical protein
LAGVFNQVVLLALLACACRGGTPPDGATEARAIPSSPPIHREVEVTAEQRLSYRVDCRADEECAVGWVSIDCCGTQRAVGVRKDALVDLEQRAKELPGYGFTCECLAKYTTLDNGTAMEDPSMIRVTCLEGACATSPATGVEYPP